MSYSLTLATGRVQAGEIDMIWTPRTIRGSGKYGVVLNHGANTADMYANLTWVNATRMAAALANAGIPCIVPSDNTDRYANDTEMSRIDTAISVLSSATGCASGKAHMVGISMGGGASLRYASLNPTKVASVNAILPMANLIHLYRTDTPATLRSLAATAWGLAAPKTTTATCSWLINSSAITIVSGQLVIGDVGKEIYHASFPLGTTISSVSGTAVVVSNNSTIAGSSQALSAFPSMPTTSPNADINALATALSSNSIPTRLFYSTVDAYITASDVTTVAATAGGTAIALDSTFGHADGTVGELMTYNSGTEFSDLISNLYAHGA